jgi:hypothetical protein
MCWHKWGKWVDTNSGEIKNANHLVIGKLIEQEKRCEKCGMVKLRTAKWKHE